MTIYVYLEDEGTDVWRPVEAEDLGDGRYRIVSPAEDDDMWQFESGSLVRCEEKTFSDGLKGLVAVERL